MRHDAMRHELLYACDGVAAGPVASSAPQASPVDTAIGRCEKLRRVLELEEWISAGLSNELLVSTCRAWQAERQELLAQLDL
jgi:hypothetical protein